MESPRARACPSCAAPADPQQRWCLECGAELPGQRRQGLRPAVGIATTLAVLVAAASAGGYTLLQDDRQPPPAATTVAQALPATPPAETLPPATQEPAPYTPPAADSSTPGFGASGSSAPGAPGTGGASSSSRSGGFNATGRGGHGAGAAEPEPETEPTTTTPQEPRLALTDVALGAAAVVYAPYAPDTVDLGDPSRTVDGSTRSVWRAPAATDPAASPQVGVYVDLASRETIRRLVIHTPTPGIGVEIYAARSGPPETITDAGWDHVASREDIAEEAKVKLPARAYRYVLVWIVAAPPDGARPAISELSLLSMQPE
jgi:hypothetical protein